MSELLYNLEQSMDFKLILGKVGVWNRTYLTSQKIKETMMDAIRDFIRSMKMICLLTIFSLGALLSACSQEPRLPQDAQEALVGYWQSLPSASNIDHKIVRVWLGVAPESSPAMDIWCVEAEITSAEDQSIVGEQLTWIIFRENESAAWSASLLAVMSSIWPYEACQP